MNAAAILAPSTLPLTEAQSGLYYAQRLDPDNPLFNTGLYVEIEGRLDLEAFRQAVDTVVREADALALAIFEENAEPVQMVDEARRPWLTLTDLSGADDPHAAALEAIRADIATPLDPARDALAAHRLYRLGETAFVFYQRIHHLAIDGFGTALLAKRLSELYAEATGTVSTRGEPLAGLARVFAEDADYRASERRGKDAAYWHDHLAGLPDSVGMVQGRAVSARSYRRVRRLWKGMAGLKALADRVDIPWPDVLTGLAGAYCQRFTSGAELVAGVPQMNRFGSAAARVPAMVMNVLPLRIAPERGTDMKTFLSSVARDLVRARRHGRYRSEQMRRDLGLIGGQKRLYGPLINVLPFDEPLALAGLQTRTTVLSTGPVDDLTLTFRGNGSQDLVLELDANPDLYAEDEVEAHADRLLAFLDAALDAPTLGAVPTASAQEAHDLIFSVNATDHPFPQTSLSALISASMARTPDAPAVVFEDETLTYRDLDQRSAALAAQLRAMGVGRQAIVGIALPRSSELIVGLVAILRAGGAYLPLDLDHPPERLGRILRSAQPALVLALPEAREALAGTATLGPADWWTAGTGDHEAGPGPDDAAYVIYTSGSTGEPKGVVVEHRAIVNRLEWMRSHYGFSPADRILQKTPMSFDVSVWEFFLPLVTGACLVVAPPGAHRDPRALAHILREKAITTAHFVPSMLAAFLAEPDAHGLAIDRVFCSGEELGADLRDRFHRTVRGQLHNLYGPTEAAVDVSYWPADAADRSKPVPIGFPVWNTRLYILDEAMQPVPVGVTGELYLGGVQLARGYLGQPGLTAERFLPDPFRPGERIYKTGDLARRRPDGAVVYLGRTDHQVKIRGLRIELGEIEAAAMASGIVRAGVALAREDRPGDRRLVLYVVPGEGYSALVLRELLSARLVDYMMPAAIVEIAELPVTANGKLDRKALPAPQFLAPASRPAESATEKSLSRLYAQTLGLAEPPGAEADFFALGGDSLSAVNLLLGIREALGTDPGLGTLFEHPTIAELARRIDAEDRHFDAGLGPVIRLGTGRDEVPPLFVVHPAGGIAWCYRGLARHLAPHRTTYGLQAPTLDPHEPVAESIAALAADYARRVMSLEPKGPIHLAGWSVGGLIAQAMAVALARAGRQVGLVAMFDSYPSECWRAEPEPTEIEALRSLLSIAGYDPEEHPDLLTRQQIVAFLRAGDSPLGALSEDALDGVIRAVTQTNRLVREHYHEVYPGTLTHIRAALDHEGRALYPELWAPYARGLDRIDVPFLHPQLTGPEATEAIAPALAARMDRIDEETISHA